MDGASLVGLTLILVIGIPLMIGIGYGINYILFEGLILFRNTKDSNKIKKRKNNFWFASLFGSLCFVTAYFYNDSKFSVFDSFLPKQYSFIAGWLLVFLLIGIFYLIDYKTRNKEKKKYFLVSGFILLLISALFSFS